MDTGTFSMILFALIALVGGYLILTDAVEGRAKLILIVFIAVITLVLILNMGLFSNSKKILDSPFAATTATLKPLTNYKYTESFSLTTWIYVNDWNLNNGKPKYIIQRDLGKNQMQPSMYLDPYENQLNIDYSINNGAGSSTLTIQIPNISTQKWVNITSCFSDTNIDTYINGKLVNTTIPTNALFYPTQPKTGAPQFNICPNGIGFSGFISNTYYYDHFLTPQEAWNIYRKGYSNNMLGNYLNKYNASFTFYDNQNQVAQFYIM
jgi:hypothetical protein